MQTFSTKRNNTSPYSYLRQASPAILSDRLLQYALPVGATVTAAAFITKMVLAANGFSLHGWQSQLGACAGLTISILGVIMVAFAASRQNTAAVVCFGAACIAIQDVLMLIVQ